MIGPQCLRMCRSATAANSAANAGHSLHRRWNSLPFPEPKFLRLALRLAAEGRTPSLNTSKKPDGFAWYRAKIRGKSGLAVLALKLIWNNPASAVSAVVLRAVV